MTDPVHPETAGTGSPFGGYVPLVRIENDTGVGFKTKVFIDGVDVSSCVTDAVIHTPVDGVVTATLKVLVSELEIDGAKTTMESFTVRPGAQELLVRNGWTPPAGEVTPGDGEK